jgi:hypothetical protein
VVKAITAPRPAAEVARVDTTLAPSPSLQRRIPLPSAAPAHPILEQGPTLSLAQSPRKAAAAAHMQQEAPLTPVETAVLVVVVLVAALAERARVVVTMVVMEAAIISTVVVAAARLRRGEQVRRAVVRPVPAPRLPFLVPLLHMLLVVLEAFKMEPMVQMAPQIEVMVDRVVEVTVGHLHQAAPVVLVLSSSAIQLAL